MQRSKLRVAMLLSMCWMFYFQYSSIILTGVWTSTGVTHSSSSCPFLCTLVIYYDHFAFFFQNFWGHFLGSLFGISSCKDLYNETQVSSGNFKLQRFVQQVSSSSTKKKSCLAKGKFHPQLKVRQQAWHLGRCKITFSFGMEK